MVIPIENIYYLLCYAWNTLDEKEQVKVSVDDKTDLVDLFAKILSNGTRILLKKGLEKNYVTETLELAGVKGKLEMGPSLKSGLLLKQRTVCTIDEFSANILSNQVILSTLYRLLKTRELSSELKKQIKPLLWMFDGIQPIDLNNRVFSQLRLHRNNRFYSFLIKVCRIIFESTLPTEKPGELMFVDFLREERKMSVLFEAFLFNFFKREFPQWYVRKEFLNWQFSVEDIAHNDYIPRMETDISIDAPAKKIIIDAKYYREALVNNYGNEKIKSVNLYQLFSYLLNQGSEDDRSLQTTGILIYPTTSQELDLFFKYQQHNILIKTINLNMHWKKIEKRLKNIVEAEMQ